MTEKVRQGERDRDRDREKYSLRDRRREREREREREIERKTERDQIIQKAKIVANNLSDCRHKIIQRIIKTVTVSVAVSTGKK